MIRTYDQYSLLGGLARVFAPTPRLYVFKDVHGIQLDIQRDPYTHQKLIGMSGELYSRLRTKLMNEQNAHLDERVDNTTIVNGTTYDFVFPPPFRVELDETTPVTMPTYTRVTLEPKPVRV